MRKRKVQPETENKILDVNASMQGTLRFDDPVNLRISGKFEGTLDTKGVLMIGKKADIKANMTGDSISIAGNVTGNIKAFKILKLDATAVLNGNVEAPKLSIAEGAVLNGQLRMTQGGGQTDQLESAFRGDWMTADQLADYLEVEQDKISEWANNSRLPATREGDKWIFERSKIDQWIAEGKVKG